MQQKRKYMNLWNQDEIVTRALNIDQAELWIIDCDVWNI